MHVCLVGSAGRLAAAIIRAAEREGVVISASIDRNEAAPSGEETIDVVIDASTPEGTLRATEIALNKGVPLVVCTTGLPSEVQRTLEEAARSIPLLLAPNTSLGVAVVARMLQMMAGMLAGYSVRIEETHHVKKIDKPSGTARLFAEFINSGGGERVHDEEVISHRTGDVVGAHTITFTGESEVIRIEHEAVDRVLFGYGAIFAAKWLSNQSPGKYTMQDVLD